jgi:hypothetical protein
MEFHGYDLAYIRSRVILFRLIRVDAGSNTSTVALKVVGGDEKGSLKSETVKYGQESYRIRIRG